MCDPIRKTISDYESQFTNRCKELAKRKKPVDRKEMFIDVGAASAGEARGKFGVREGDPIVPFAPCAAMTRKDLLMGKAWDDRVGVALFIDLIKQLAEGRVRHPNTVYGVGTVMEEVGTRGAQTAAHLVNPDICIVLEVGIASDTPGIKPEDMGLLFQEFSQVDVSPSRRHEGTGLGLVLCRRFVELHGGTIGADSVYGHGSTFWFLLPVDGPIRRAPLVAVEPASILA
jgi:hypothetical protein